MFKYMLTLSTIFGLLLYSIFATKWNMIFILITRLRSSLHYYFTWQER